MAKKDDSFAITSFVLGILSIIIPRIGIVLGAVAIALYIIVRARKSNNKYALWGFILGIIGIVLQLLHI